MSGTWPSAFFFVRHGETDWNRVGRLQGQHDVPLNGRGRDQAAVCGRTLVRLARDRRLDVAGLEFVASPLGRARQTMEILREAMRLPRDGFRVDERLAELSFGGWEGRTWPELKISDPEAYVRRRSDKWGFVPPGGESYAGLVDRVRPWLDTVEENAVVVSHGGIARVLLHLLVGLNPRDAPDMDIPQGRVLLCGAGRADWI